MGAQGADRLDDDAVRRHVAGWTARCLRVGPLTPDERRDVERALRVVHLAAGTWPPLLVVWCPTMEQAAGVSARRDALGQEVLRRRAGLRARLRLWRLLALPSWTLLGAWGGWLAGSLVLVAVLLLVAFGKGVALLAAVAAVLGALWWAVPAGRRPSRWVPVGVGAVLWLVGLVVLRPLAGQWTIYVGDARWPGAPAAVLMVGGAVAGAWLGGRGAWRWRPKPLRPEVASRLSRRTAARAGWPSAFWAAWNADPRSSVNDALRGASVSVACICGWALRRRTSWELRAYETLCRVSWYTHGTVVVVGEPPLEAHLGVAGLHRFDGPAVVWADGTEWFYENGMRLPRDPRLGDWTADEIHATRNTELRRTMIEALGWDRYVEEAGLELVAEAPDPGNPPHRLALYDLPFEFEGQSLLVMTNGSPDRSGRLRVYGEFVPAGFDDPVEAVAWQYGVPAEVYRRLERRT